MTDSSNTVVAAAAPPKRSRGWLLGCLALLAAGCILVVGAALGLAWVADRNAAVSGARLVDEFVALVVGTATPTPTPTATPTPIATPTPTPPPIPQACGQTADTADYGPVGIGTTVILGEHRPVNGDANWADEMAAFVGQQAVVTRLSGVDPIGCPGVRVDIDNGQWFWRLRDLTLP